MSAVAAGRRARTSQGAERGHELRAVDERQALLRLERDRLEADRGERRGAGGTRHPPTPRPSPTRGRRGVRAARDRRSRLRSRGRGRAGETRRFRHSTRSSTVSIRAPEKPLASALARSSIAARTTSSGVGLADAARVAAEQAELQLLGQLLRDECGDETAEARVHAVGVLPHPLHECPCRLHPGPRLVRERHRHTMDGDLPDILDPKVVPRQGRGLLTPPVWRKMSIRGSGCSSRENPVKEPRRVPNALARKASGAWALLCPGCAAGSRPPRTPWIF